METLLTVNTFGFPNDIHTNRTAFGLDKIVIGTGNPMPNSRVVEVVDGFNNGATEYDFKQALELQLYSPAATVLEVKFAIT